MYILDAPYLLHWACTVGLCGVWCVGWVGGIFSLGKRPSLRVAATSDTPDASGISMFLVTCHSVALGFKLLFLVVKLSDTLRRLCCAFLVI